MERALSAQLTDSGKLSAWGAGVWGQPEQLLSSLLSASSVGDIQISYILFLSLPSLYLSLSENQLKNYKLILLKNPEICFFFFQENIKVSGCSRSEKLTLQNLLNPPPPPLSFTSLTHPTPL